MSNKPKTVRTQENFLVPNLHPYLTIFNHPIWISFHYIRTYKRKFSGDHNHSCGFRVSITETQLKCRSDAHGLFEYHDLSMTRDSSNSNVDFQWQRKVYCFVVENYSQWYSQTFLIYPIHPYSTHGYAAILVFLRFMKIIFDVGSIVLMVLQFLQKTNRILRCWCKIFPW